MTGNRGWLGGGIYVNASGEGPGKLTISGGTIKDNTASEKGGAILVDDSMFYVSGAPVVAGNSASRGKNIVLTGERVMNVEGAIDGAAQIDFVADNIPRAVTEGLGASTDPLADQALSHFTYNDSGNAALSVEDDELYVAVEADVWVSDWQALQQAINNSTPRQVIGLAEDITAETPDKRVLVSKGKDVTIELAGHELNRNLYAKDGDEYKAVGAGYSEYDGRVIQVDSGATLTVRDASADMGEITGGNAGKGAGVNVDGTFVLEGGAICVNHAKTEGGGVRINESATFKATGGLITQNNTDNTGGGVYVVRGSVAELSGCQVV